MADKASEIELEVDCNLEQNNLNPNGSAESVQPAHGKEDAEDQSEAYPQDPLAAALEEKAVCHDKMLRMAAELDNYKKRMMRERDNALKYAGESLIRDLLPTLDNLERALDHDREGDITVFMEGVDMTFKGLLSTLEKAGLKQINSVGEPFDPNLHEALAMEASKDVPDQCIVREFERGYHFKDRLLRAAKVVVSKGDV